MLDPIIRIIKETEIPIGQFLPTHISRTPALLEQSIQFAKMGGNIDFTASVHHLAWAEISGKAIRKALDAGVSIEQMTLSSDSNGSMPVFDEKGKLAALAVGDIKNLYLDWRESVREGLPIEEALKLVTINAAKRIAIDRNKGSLEMGKDADLLILDKELNIETVIAKGQLMVHEGKVVVKGTFE